MTCSAKGGAALAFGKFSWVILLKADLSWTIYLRVQDAIIYSRVSQTSVRNSLFTEIQNQEEGRMSTAGKVRTFLYPHDLVVIMWGWFLELEHLKVIIWDISWGIRCLGGDTGGGEGGAYQCANKNEIKQYMEGFLIRHWWKMEKWFILFLLWFILFKVVYTDNINNLILG